MDKKPRPVKLTRAQDEVNDRKTGLHLTRWTLHFTILGSVLMALALVVAVGGVGVTVYLATRNSMPGLVGEQVVAKPDAGVGGVAVYAVPKAMEDAPVDYLSSGALLRVDCMKLVEIENEHGYYEFLRLSRDSTDAGRWIALDSLVMQDGSDAGTRLQILRRC